MTDKPEVSKRLQGYIFDWKSHGISIIANRVQIHKSDGRVTGEIYVDAQNGKGKPVTIYPPTAFNFSADRTRKELAKTLTTKNKDIPWPEMVDQLCYGLIARARQGEPVLELHTSDDTKPPEYLIDPLIVKNYPNVIFGDPGSAKSTSAVILAQVLSLPWHDNQMGIKAPAKPQRVLYLDWETDPDTIQWQMTTLQRSTDIGSMFIYYRHCSMPLAQDVEQIRDKIAEVNADVMIIDSVGLAAGGDLNDSQPALALYAGIRDCNITALLLAHNSKNPESKKRSMYGNQMYTALARNIWEIRKNSDENSPELDLALFHIKTPPFAGLHEPIGFKIKFDNQKGIMEVKPNNPKNVEKFLENMTLRTRIIETLRREAPLAGPEIAARLKADPEQVRARLNDLKGKGITVKVDDGWGLCQNY